MNSLKALRYYCLQEKLEECRSDRPNHTPISNHPRLDGSLSLSLFILEMTGLNWEVLSCALSYGSTLQVKILRFLLSSFKSPKMSLTPSRFNWCGCGVYLLISSENKELIVPFWRLSTTPFHRILWWSNIFIIFW